MVQFQALPSPSHQVLDILDQTLSLHPNSFAIHSTLVMLSAKTSPTGFQLLMDKLISEPSTSPAKHLQMEYITTRDTFPTYLKLLQLSALILIPQSLTPLRHCTMPSLVTLSLSSWSSGQMSSHASQEKYFFLLFLVFIDLLRIQQAHVWWCSLRNCFVHRFVVRSRDQWSIRW